MRPKKLKSAYVYLLRSLKDSKFYLGWTTNLSRRLEEHNMGLTRSTKSRRPFEMVHYETYPTPELARKRERTLKRCPRMLYLFKRRALSKREREVVGDPTTSPKKRGLIRILVSEGTKEVVG